MLSMYGVISKMREFDERTNAKVVGLNKMFNNNPNSMISIYTFRKYPHSGCFLVLYYRTCSLNYVKEKKLQRLPKISMNHVMHQLAVEAD